MENWAESMNKIIEAKLAGIKDKERRFYRIDEFERNIGRIDLFEKNCMICKQHKSAIPEIVKNIDKAVNVPGKARREYDKIISDLSKHIQKEHKYYPPYYFTYLFSFYGILLGSAIGFVLLKIIPEYKWAMFSLGLSISLITAYYYGFFKDKKIRSEKKIM